MTTTITPTDRLALIQAGIDNLRTFCDGLTADHEKWPPGSLAYTTAETVLNLLDTGKPSGTMRDWMLAHHGQQVATIQMDTRQYGWWAPTGRIVDAKSGATFVQFSGLAYAPPSTRYYAGMRVLRASENILIVGDETHVIAYIVE